MTTPGRLTKLQRSFAYRLSKWFPSAMLAWMDLISAEVDNAAAGIVQPIVQVQDGTDLAPVNTELWRVTPKPATNPPWGMYVSGPASLGVIDTVYSLGINAGQDNAFPRATLNMEASYSPSPGVVQMEVYFESTAIGGIDSARPMGYVYFTAGPDLGKVDTAIQYVGKSLTMTGGTIGAPAQQWFVTDDQMLLVPSNYTVVGNNGLVVGSNAGRLTTIAAADWFMRAGAQSNISIDVIDFAKFNTTPTATLTTSSGEYVLLPAADNTGQIGANGTRFRLLRAVTITSGDLHLQDEERGAHWILREMPDHILAINEITKQSYRLLMEKDATSYDEHQAAHLGRMAALEERAAKAVAVLEEKALAKEARRLDEEKKTKVAENQAARRAGDARRALQAPKKKAKPS